MSKLGKVVQGKAPGSKKTKAKKARKARKARKAAPAPPPPVDDSRPPSRSPARRRRMARTVPKAAPKPKPVAEPESVQRARKRLRGLIKQATGDAPPEAVGLVLAIVTQETGNHAAANALIDEYGLEKTFGIKKF